MIQQALSAYPAAELLDRAQQEAEIAEANQSSLGILTALFALSVLVGILGVGNTFTLAIVDRIREVGCCERWDDQASDPGHDPVGRPS